MVAALDISRHQGEWTNPEATVKSGVSFIYMRGLNGLREDDRVHTYADIAKTHSIPFGLYIYARPKIDAGLQADRIVKMTEEFGCDLLPMIDIEAHDDRPQHEVSRWAADLLNQVEQKTGRAAVVYSAGWFWNPMMNSADHGNMQRRFRWVARYVSKEHPGADVRDWPAFIEATNKNPVAPNGWGDWDAWQFSADGNGAAADLGGFTSHAIDCNVVDARALGKLFRGAPTSASMKTAGFTPAEADVHVPVGQPAPPAGMGFPARVRRGSKNVRVVKMLQSALKAVGHAPGPVDGIFGPRTEAALKAFQAQAGITVDGVAGKAETWPALRAAGGGV